MESLEVHEWEPHTETVHGDHPWTGPAGVAKHGGGGGPVRPEGRPAFAAGLTRIEAEFALPFEAVVAEAERPAPTRLHLGVAKRWRLLVVVARVVDPAEPCVLGVSFGKLNRHPRVVPGKRESSGRHGHGQKRLVHTYLGG